MYKDEFDYSNHKICKTCGDIYYRRKCESFKHWEGRKFCSLFCRRPSNNKNLKNRIFIKSPTIPYVLICLNCNKEFTVKTNYARRTRKFCSKSCVTIYHQKNRNYWDNDTARKEKLRKKQKELVENGEWNNPILIGDAAKRMKETKAKNPVVFTEDRLELASKIAAQRLVDGENENLGCYLYGKIGTFYSEKNNCNIKFRSSFERKAYELLEDDNNVLSYIVEPFRIKYIINKKVRYYVPDLLITYNNGVQKLVEIKPVDKLLTKDTLIKQKFSIEYCNSNNIEGGYEIWTETVLFPNRNY